MQYDSYQHIHIHTPCMVLYSREYDMHTSVHELCMHNFIHTLYCAYLSVLLVQCTLYTTYSMHTRVLRARVHTTSQYSRVWYAYNHSSSNTHVLFILCILASSTRSQRTLYTYYERRVHTLDMHRSATRVLLQQSMHNTRVVCILRVVEEESTHDQRHNFCLILVVQYYITSRIIYPGSKKAT